MSCAKCKTTCVIKTTSGKEYFGENICLAPQTECPRLTGEGYEKCKSICFQLGHAEELALYHAIQDGAELNGAKAIIAHERVCDNCSNILTHHGITDITFTGINYVTA